ncbi:F0F1 ATP synthase subunit epsilon [Roseitranquillus sediminis]|uniref:F0F1 ATP synthase subunit epsilon n=1 Tax=Roseitranquillus sediminis TaxID=2809051 RepID=UPI001D0C12EB|nr:F0F1 ATP synthase subunit epsilon [Roseitranquillus sediminis]MBM9595884.1 F0F1 ATP synthase subunit epsilon [Roseitranquillus sediminis]
MADTFQFDLVSPERRLTSVEATSVMVPGAEGDMTVMASHAPTITSLRPGLLRVEAQGGQQEFVVTGGFAEIGADGVTVLAERALPRDEVTRDVMNAMVREAAEVHKSAREREEDGVDEAAKLVADMVAVGTHIGLDPEQPNL